MEKLKLWRDMSFEEKMASIRSTNKTLIELQGDDSDEFRRQEKEQQDIQDKQRDIYFNTPPH